MAKILNYNKDNKAILDNNVADFVHALAKENCDKEAIVFKDDFRTVRYTYKNLYENSLKIVSYFDEHGIEKGDKVIIWSYNSPEWVAVFLACIVSGVIAVPLDFNSDASFVEKIYKNIGAKKIFTSQYKCLEIDSKLEMEDLFFNLKDYKTSNKKVEIYKNDILEIVYTSGTTSDPKGVVIRHSNIVANINSLRYVMEPKKSSKFLSIIPLSHMLEQTLGFFVPMRFACPIVYVSSRKSSLLAEAIKEEKISMVVGVPAFLKVLKGKIEREIEKSGMKDKLRKVMNLPLPLRKIILRNKIDILKSLRFFVVGGSPLDSSVENFWDEMGVLVLQGYGLTETSPIMACNTEKHHKIGTVGRVLPNQKIKIGKDGEIMCKGINVFSEYFENEKETKKVFKKGWFVTGDLGEIDKKGFLSIKGRKKNMILSDSGLNVYPEDIEQKINELKEVKDSCVLGVVEDKRVVITAVVILIKENKELLEKINSELASHQQVQKLIIWKKDDFPRTPSLKVKRKDLEKIIQEDSQEEVVVNVKDKLFLLLSKLTEVDSGKIKNSSKLYKDLKVDSLRRVELISILEEEYGVEIPEDKINKGTKVSDLKKLIKEFEGQKIKNIFSFWSFLRIINPFRYLLQQIIFLFLRLFYSIEIQGFNDLKKVKTPVVFAINHSSHLDTPTLLKALPWSIRKKVAFAGAEDYFFETKESENNCLKKIKIFFIRLAFNVYPFSRDKNIKRSLKRTGEILDRGFSIAIYPEGTRTTSGKINHFLTGIGLLASKMKVPVVPVRIEGLFDVLPKGKFLPRRSKVRLCFGKVYVAESKKSFIDISKEIENIVREL